MRRDDQPINRDQIVRAALEIVDEEGSGALSMRALASRLDRHVSSLYNHVTNRGELIELLSAQMVKSIDYSVFADLPWDAAIAAWSRSYVTCFTDHPNLVQVLATSPVRDTPTLAMYESILEALTHQGWPLRDAITTMRTVEAHAWGSVFDIITPNDPGFREQLPPDLPLSRLAVDPDELDNYGGWPSYESGITALIIGLRARYAALAHL